MRVGVRTQQGTAKVLGDRRKTVDLWKFESRNPKSETNSKRQGYDVQKKNAAVCGFGHLNLDFWSLFRISGFELRNLKFSTGCEELAA
jgi:hypothetical protein